MQRLYRSSSSNRLRLEARTGDGCCLMYPCCQKGRQSTLSQQHRRARPPRMDIARGDIASGPAAEEEQPNNKRASRSECEAHPLPHHWSHVVSEEDRLGLRIDHLLGFMRTSLVSVREGSLRWSSESRTYAWQRGRPDACVRDVCESVSDTRAACRCCRLAGRGSAGARGQGVGSRSADFDAGQCCVGLLHTLQRV